MTRLTPVAVAAASFALTLGASAQTAAPAAAASASAPGSPEVTTMPQVTVRASADASAQGLSPAYAGGQVARGGRAGILGTRDNMETPFSITSYTNELIQDKQARSVGEVLLNDPTVRSARGFGNFQEAYFIRGFLLNSDDVAYNGLYSLLPRQYIATELFERVEVLRGASAFLNGVTPGGSGIGGTINLLPKRAPNAPLTRATLGVGPGSQFLGSADIARRFGPDGSTGVRLNVSRRDGGTSVDHERAELDLVSLAADWRSRDVRVSADIGYQNNKLDLTRPNVSLGGVTSVPKPPDASENFAQRWSYSNERDTFGTLRGEWDVSRNLTAWAAYGFRRSKEANSLANPTVSDADTGDASTSRFDNTRRDRVDTGEVGLRGKARFGPISNEWVVSAGQFRLETKNAFAFSFTQLATNLYDPVDSDRPDFTDATTFFGNDLADPRRTNVTRLTSFVIGDTIGAFDDRLLVTLGLRRQRIGIEDFAYGSGDAADPYKRSKTSPLVAAVFRVDPKLSLYANYVQGLTKGDTAPTFVPANPDGTPGTPPTNAGRSLAPYVSKQKEVGAKVDLGSVGGGLALFTTTRPRAFIDAGNTFVAAGEDRHRGAELSLFGKVSPALTWLGGATYLDAKQKDTGSDATDDNRVIGVPKLQANFGVDWAVPGVEGLAFDGRVVYTGKRYADDANTLRVGSWTRLDLGVRYLFDVSGRLVTLRGRVDNVTDRDYWASVGGYPGIGYLVVGAPRTFTLSASVDF